MRLLIFILLCAGTAFSQIPPIEPGVSQELAKWRASQYSNISYKLNLTLEKMSPVLKGTIEIRVTVPRQDKLPGVLIDESHGVPIALDWRRIPGHEKDSTISNPTVNGMSVVFSSTPMWNEPGRPPMYTDYHDHLVFYDGVRIGENVIKLDFTSPILTSGSAITRYVDKEDGAEYIYSLFVPSDASTAFPVFDQPDLKARFSLEVATQDGWKVVSNGNRKGGWTMDGMGAGFVTHGTSFEETQPISTYVFAFAAGPFERVSEPPALAGGKNAAAKSTSESLSQAATNPAHLPPAYAGGSDKTPPTSIYVRKSQSEKFKPHAAQVFRLNREAVKYLETYFDYKFPFPKYDLVLIPEFPFGGMEHAGATFLREQSIIFPQEPTKNDIITRANLIFHEAAHQWFGDTVTMKWFDDLWLKEGFATFMAYKALDKIMPEANAWKVFYERVKQAAYRTDSTRGTTAIYLPIANLNSAKSAYGNIVYNKAPAFLRQAEFYLGEQKFQTAVRAFLKKHEFGNATWQDLVGEFGTAGKGNLEEWAKSWITQRGMPRLAVHYTSKDWNRLDTITGKTYGGKSWLYSFVQRSDDTDAVWEQEVQVLIKKRRGESIIAQPLIYFEGDAFFGFEDISRANNPKDVRSEMLVFPNYRDYGYGIFLLDDKSRDYVLKNIQNEKDDFLRTMMWGSLWDSVREAELDPKVYVELVIKNIGLEKDEGAIQTLLSRVTTAMNYYLPDTGGNATVKERALGAKGTLVNTRVSARKDLRSRLEDLVIDKIQNASTQGQRVTYYRSFLNIASTDKARGILKQILKATTPKLTLKTKDKFDIVTRLAILGDPDAAKLLAGLEKTETSDDAKRYAYAAHAAFATVENKAKFWNDFINNKTISESWIEAAAGPFNSIQQSGLTLPYLEKALAELPKLKRERKIFFVNDWLGDFIGGQRDEKALAIVNKFLADNPNLDRDLRLKILENSDLIERAVKIRAKFPN